MQTKKVQKSSLKSVVCCYCGDAFLPVDANHRFCSVQCQKKHFATLPRAKSITIRRLLVLSD